MIKWLASSFDADAQRMRKERISRSHASIQLTILSHRYSFVQAKAAFDSTTFMICRPTWMNMPSVLKTETMIERTVETKDGRWETGDCRARRSREALDLESRTDWLIRFP
jgi:hypothetical protein